MKTSNSVISFSFEILCKFVSYKINGHLCYLIDFDTNEKRCLYATKLPLDLAADLPKHTAQYN